MKTKLVSVLICLIPVLSYGQLSTESSWGTTSEADKNAAFKFADEYISGGIFRWR